MSEPPNISSNQNSQTWKLPNWTIILALFLLIVLAGLTFPSLSASHQSSYTSEEVSFSASQPFVVLPGQCLMLDWQVENAQRVLLNGQTVESQSKKRVCPNYGYVPTLWVEYNDGRSAITELDIDILVWNHTLWSLLLTITLALLHLLMLTKGARLAAWLRIPTVVGLMLIGTGILFSYGYLLLADSNRMSATPLTIVDQTAAGQEVEFWLDRNWVKFPWQTATANWVVSHGDVYINAEYVSLSGSQVETIHPGYVSNLWTQPERGEPHYSYNLNPEILFWSSRTYSLLALGIISIVAAILLLHLQPVSHRSTLHSPIEQIPAPQLRLMHIMGGILAGLTSIFVVLLGFTVLQENLWPAPLYLVLALGIIAWALSPRAQLSLLCFMHKLYAVFVPIAWFIFSVLSLDLGMALIEAPLFWSGVQVWYASVFFWLGSYWLLLYGLTRFTFDTARVATWSAIALSTILMFAVFWALWITVWDDRALTEDWTSQPLTEPLFVRSALALNIDGIFYLQYVEDFPFSWREEPYTHPRFFQGHVYDRLVIHRPTYFMVASQMCQLLDVSQVGLLSGDRACSSSTMAVIATNVTNILVNIISCILLYELIRAYFNVPTLVQVTTGILLVTAPVNYWEIASPSTDHAELLILAVSLWLFHRLFEDKSPTLDKLITSGVLLTVLLLLKLNVTYLMFAGLLVLLMRRWRLLIPFCLMILTWLIYSVGVTLLDIPFVIAELNTVPEFGANYAWELILDVPLLSERFEWVFYFNRIYGRLVDGVATALERIMWFHGLLLPLGVAAYTLYQPLPQKLRYAFWSMVVALGIWYFVISWEYLKQVMGLMPFIYGGVALMVSILMAYINDRLGKPRFAQYAGLALMGLAVLNNVALWIILGPIAG